MQKNKINAFIYARLDSSRFPRKNLAKCGKFSLLELLFQRSQRCNFNNCYLLTSERDIDDDLCIHARAIGLDYIRGDAYDLTKRTQKALNETDSDYFVRLNGDSPFLEPSLINFAINNMKNALFVSNIFQRTFPYGISIELIQSQFYLSTLKENYLKQENLEHVTKHIYEFKNRQNFMSIKQNLNQSEHQLVVDEPHHLENLNALTKNMDLLKSNYWDILKLEPYFTKNFILVF